MNFETLVNTVINAVKEFFAPSRKMWNVAPRAVKALLIALATYVGIVILSLIPNILAPLVAICILWVIAYVGLTNKSKPKEESIAGDVRS